MAEKKYIDVNKLIEILKDWNTPKENRQGDIEFLTAIKIPKLVEFLEIIKPALCGC